MMSSNFNERKGEIEALVRRVQNGDKEAFGTLYDILVDSLYRYIYFRVKKDDVDDVIANVFLRAWENIKSYKPQKNKSFSSWIFRIAHNLIVDYYRKEKDFDFLDLNLPDETRKHNPIKNTERAFDKQILWKAMSSIRKVYQDILICKFINGLSNEEIADVLNKSEGSVRILQFRALKALKNELKSIDTNYDF